MECANSNWWRCQCQEVPTSAHRVRSQPFQYVCIICKSDKWCVQQWCLHKAWSLMEINKYGVDQNISLWLIRQHRDTCQFIRIKGLWKIILTGDSQAWAIWCQYTNCAILPSQMGEHWNMEKVDNIDQMTLKHSIYDYKHSCDDSKH